MAFTKIKIQHFRGIKNCTINDLGKHINLFVGKNNCGKTSVLDTIYLLTGMSNADLIRRINLFREYKLSDFSDFAEMNFYNLDISKSINLSCSETNEINRELTISPVLDDGFTETKLGSISNQSERKIKELEFKFTQRKGGQKNTEYASITMVNINSEETYDKQQDSNKQQIRVLKPISYKESILSVYLNSKYSLSVAINSLSTIIENKQKDIIIDSLNRIDNKITDIAIIRNNVLVDVGLDKLIPLEVLGDGTRKLLAIITSLYQCRDGILLIDEIDNGLHYSSMSILWDTILYTAKAFNVQVFATTHNIDSLKALKTVLESENFLEEQNTTICYRLRHGSEDELTAFRYDFESFEYAINMDHEIR